MKRLVDLLDESELACYLLEGLSIAAGVMFALASIVTGICAILDASWLWAFAFVLCGLVAGLSIAFAGYIYDEHF